MSAQMSVSSQNSPAGLEPGTLWLHGQHFRPLDHSKPHINVFLILEVQIPQVSSPLL